MSSIAIYLAGKIKKAHENPNEFYWSENEIQQIKHHCENVQPILLNPAIRTDNLSLQQSVFGRDMLQVFSSDFVFVDARDRRGLGVGAEMMWAKMNQIPVITLAPKDTHYHQSTTTLLDIQVNDWVHPFVESLSDVVVESIEDGCSWMLAFLANPSPVKGPAFIQDAMRFYKENQLKNDTPMTELVERSDVLGQRVATLNRSILVES